MVKITKYVEYSIYTIQNNTKKKAQTQRITQRRVNDAASTTKLSDIAGRSGREAERTFCYLAITYARGGQTFCAEGHIDKCKDLGGPYKKGDKEK